MQKSQILVALPENTQYNTLYYFHSHLKTTVKLHITVFSEVTDTEYVCFTFLLHMLFAILICSQHCAKEKNIYNKHTSHWVDLCTTILQYLLELNIQHTVHSSVNHS